MATHSSQVSGKLSALERILPKGFRQRLEQARLDLRALFRAADQLSVGQQLPVELHRLFELDADFAEALHVMDIAPRGLDVMAMLRDTEVSFAELSDARVEFLDTLVAPTRKRLETRATVVRATLDPDDAYLGIPGCDPAAG